MNAIAGKLRFLWEQRRALVALYAFTVVVSVSAWIEELRPAVHLFLVAYPIVIAVSAIGLSFRLTPRSFATILGVMVLSFVAMAGGVHIGFPFGELVYTTALGPKALDVPLVIPFLWLSILIPAWAVSGKILRYKHVVVASIVVTSFDAVLELAASSLDLWYWNEGMPSEFNYISWFLVSAILFSLLESTADRKEPHWIVPHLLIAQLLFFVLADAGIRFVI